MSTHKYTCVRLYINIFNVYKSVSHIYIHKHTYMHHHIYIYDHTYIKMYVHVQGLPVYVYSNMHACICPHNFSIKSPPGKVCSTETSGSTLLHRLGVVLKPLFLTLGGNICKIEVKPQWFIKRLSIPTIHPQSIKKILPNSSAVQAIQIHQASKNMFLHLESKFSSPAVAPRSPAQQQRVRQLARPWRRLGESWLVGGFSIKW